MVRGSSAGAGCKAAILIVLAAAVASVGCTRGPKGLSAPAFEAAEKAHAAIRRLSEYRDEPRSFFEPRLLDAQRAVDEMPGKDQMQSWGRINPNWKAADQARQCLTITNTYRLSIDLVLLDAEAVERGDRGADGKLREARASRHDTGFQLDKCLADLASYIR